MERNDFYVYVILDPRKPGTYKYGKNNFQFRPIYVGKGTGNRTKQHTYPTILAQKTHKANKLRRIIKAGLEPIFIRVKENLTEPKAFWYETRLIAKIGRGKNGPLTNLTDGGDGTSGSIRTAESKALVSRRNKEYRETASEAKLKEWYANVSAGHQSRTPEQNAELGKRYSEIQTNLGPKADKARRKKLSKSLSAYRERMTDEEKASNSRTLSNSVGKYWSQASSAERATHSNAISDSLKARGKDAERERANRIRQTILKQHATMDPVLKLVRRVMLSCANLIKRFAEANSWDADKVRAVKQRIKQKVVRYYQAGNTLCPRDLLPKIERSLLTYI